MPVRWEVHASWALFFGIALLMLGNGLQGTLLGVRAKIEGFATASIGVLMSGYYAGYLLGSVQTPRLLSRVGHIRVFAALASLASGAVLLHVVAVHPVPWVFLRLASGFAIAGLFVVAESWLNDRATNENRGRLLSVYMVVLMGGLGAGQFLLNAAPPSGFELFILASVLLSFALVPISLTAKPGPEIPRLTGLAPRAVFRAAPLGVVTAVMTGVSYSTLFAIGPVYATTVGLDPAAVSVFMAATIFGGVVVQIPLGTLSDQTDRRIVIVGAAAGAAGLAVVGALVVGASPGPLTALAALLGGLAVPLYSLGVAHTNDYLDADLRASASGTLVLLNGVGATVGPLAVSSLMAAFGADAFFWFLAATHVVVAAYALWRITRRAAVAEDERAHYEPLAARATPVVTAMLEDEATDSVPA